MSAGRDAPTDSTSIRSGLEQRWRGSSNKSKSFANVCNVVGFLRAWYLTSGNLTYLWEIININ